METSGSTPDRAGPDATGGTSPRGRRLGLTTKIVGASALAIALVAVILALSFAREVRRLLEAELSERGRMAALALANTATTGIFSQDAAGLGALAEATRANVTGAAYVIVRDEAGRALAEAVAPELGTARPPAVDSSDLGLGSRSLQREVTVAGEAMLHVIALVTFQGKSDAQYLDPLGLSAAAGAGSAGLRVLGTVEIGFPLSDLVRQIGAASRRSAGLAAIAFAACVALLIPLARVLTRPLAQLSRAALGIAQGDLRQAVASGGNDEVADLAGSFARMVAELQAMLGELQDAARALAEESEAMLAAATRQAAAASQQSAAVAEMNASIHEIAQTSTAATAHADRVIEVTATAEESSRSGGELVDEAVSSTSHVDAQVSAIAARLGELAGRVGKIGDIIGTVQELAQRSNVLSLNAAIEASRGGANGTGFAVIAHEMRELAGQSAVAAGEVPRLLGEIAQSTRAAATATEQGRDRAQASAALTRKAGATIGSLADVCRESAAAARQIAESSRQQVTGVTEIVAALAQLARAAEGNVEDSQAMARSAERLREVSGRLTGLAQRYRS